MKKRGISLFLALLMLLVSIGLPAFAEKSEAAETVVEQTETESRAVKPKKISISGPKKVEVGEKITLKATVKPAGASQKVKWKSADETIAKVNKNGVVTGVNAGKVKIYAISKSNTSISKSVTIKVTDSTPDPDPDPTPSTGKYYALLVGNNYFGSGLNPLYGTHNDVKALNGALSKLSQGWQISAKYDLSASGMRSSINSAFSGATAADTCLFFFTGHGDTSYGSTSGALAGNDGSALTASQLASALNSACPGKVIVLLDSCGSGAMIDKNANDEGSPVAFTQAIISAFSARNKTLTGKNGELLGSKFTVLVAASKYTSSLDLGPNSINDYYNSGAFTLALVDGLGCKYPNGTGGSSMPADSNGDKKLTLSETYSYIDRFMRQNGINQSTQYAGDLNMVLFTR